MPLDPSGRWARIAFYDGNDYALVAVSTLPMALFLAQSGRRVWWRLGGVGAAALLLVCIARAGSRGGLLGLAAVTTYLAFRHRSVSRWARVAVVLVVASAIAIVGRAQIGTTVDTLRHPTADYNWAGNDYDGRIELWKRGLGYLRDRPLTGVGLAAFPVAEGELSEVARARMAHGQDVKPLVAHNMYIQVAAELGAVAAAVFLFLLWRTYRTFVAVAAAFEPADGATPRGVFGAAVPPESTLPRLLAASFIGYCCSGLFIAAAYMAYLPMLIGFAGALARVVPAWVTESPAVRTSRAARLADAAEVTG